MSVNPTTLPCRAQVAARYLKLAISEFGQDDNQIKQYADMLASQADSLDAESVAYSCYASYTIPGDKYWLVEKLVPKLLLVYRKNLISWLSHGILKRANIGSGGRKEEAGLQKWVDDIPKILIAKKWDHKIAPYLPEGDENEYLRADKLDSVGKTLVRKIWDAAVEAKMLPDPRAPQEKTATNKMAVESDDPMPSFTVQVDLKGQRNGIAMPLWYIDSYNTYPWRDKIRREFKFLWNPQLKRWETARLTPKILENFTVVGLPEKQPKQPKLPKVPKTPRAPIEVNAPEVVVPESASEELTQVTDWFLNTWYPENMDKLSKLFTEVARNLESSYKILFSVEGGHPKVDFERNITTVAEAVEELRYRYIGREGRGPWLEVLDEYAKLIQTTSVAKLPAVIDRINNLEHSNGAFSEHYPKEIQRWHGGFLNAKYNTPLGIDLAKQIPDKGLRYIMYEANQRKTRHITDFYEVPVNKYRTMTKDLAEKTGPTWRQLGYPRFKGDAGKQVSRFDPRVQKFLDIFQKLETQKASILSIEPQSATEYAKMEQSVEDWQRDYDTFERNHRRIIEELEAARLAAHARDLDDPSFIAQWEKEHPAGSGRMASAVSRVASRFLLLT